MDRHRKFRNPLFYFVACVAALQLLGCSKQVPCIVPDPEIRADMHCFVIEGKAGGLVCFESAGVCADAQMATVQYGGSQGVTAVSGCKLAEVTADKKE